MLKIPIHRQTCGTLSGRTHKGCGGGRGTQGAETIGNMSALALTYSEKSRWNDAESCKLRLRRLFSGPSVPDEHGELIKGDEGGGEVAGSSQVELPCSARG